MARERALPGSSGNEPHEIEQVLQLLVRAASSSCPHVVGDVIQLSRVTDGLDRVAAGRSHIALDITA
jgi:hypothetical protein